MKHLKTILLVILVVAVTLAPMVVFGADNGDGPSTGRKIWDTVWRFINFFILVFVLVKFGREPIKNFLAEHSADIDQDLHEHQTRVQEAQNEYQDVEQRLAKIEDMIEEVRQLHLNEAQRTKDSILEMAKQNADHIMEEAKRQAETAVQKTRDQMKAELVEKAIEEAENLIRTHFKPEDEDRLVGEYMDQLAEASSNRAS
jgi:F-type H+-transporting ATPase subunit b